MYIKQLIKDKEHYWEFVWPFINWANNPNRSLWREEDYPKLKPFFDMQNRNEEWPQEVKESFDFYQKCREEYGEKNTELRDAVSKFSAESILEAFGYKIPEYNDDNEEEYNKDEPLSLDEDFDATFPFVVIGDISCEWDRCGDFNILSLHMVSLKDFKVDKS